MIKKIFLLFAILFSSNAYARATLDSVMLQVRDGDTLVGILESIGFDKTSVAYAIDQLRHVYDPSQLTIGQQIKVAYSAEEKEALPPELVSLNIRLNSHEEVTMKRQIDGNFLTEQQERKVETRQVKVHGTIQDTLYGSAQEAGLPASVLASLIKLYSYDVDFQRDIKKGNSFTVLFEEIVDTDSEKVVEYGNITYAQMDINNESLEAYRYLASDGEARYYDALGRSIEKSLLKTPMDGAKVTSGFGNRRHPILGFNRMHKGIDFGAPAGTPVYAAGDGKITFLGRNGNYGNYIKITHRENYASAYAHLKGFKSGLKKNSPVRQGDIIGYVGTTGMSTGPHLHYELLLSNRQVNPLSIKSVPGDKLSGSKFARFEKYKQYVEAKLADPSITVSFNEWQAPVTKTTN
jgi:murein DD-endopeptidase MepM/ murein hydrolase activator NlpD